MQQNPSVSSNYAPRLSCSLLMVLMMFAPCLADEEKAVSDQIALRVLYAGNPGSARMNDFEALLQRHFKSVHTTDYREFEPSDAKDHDVVIFDWTTIYPRDEEGKITWEEGGFSSPQPPALDRDFGRPTVLIGAAGGSICQQMQIAINWK